VCVCVCVCVCLRVRKDRGSINVVDTKPKQHQHQKLETTMAPTKKLQDWVIKHLDTNKFEFDQTEYPLLARALVVADMEIDQFDASVKRLMVSILAGRTVSSSRERITLSLLSCS